MVLGLALILCFCASAANPFGSRQGTAVQLQDEAEDAAESDYDIGQSTDHIAARFERAGEGEGEGEGGG